MRRGRLLLAALRIASLLAFCLSFILPAADAPTYHGSRIEPGYKVAYLSFLLARELPSAILPPELDLLVAGTAWLANLPMVLAVPYLPRLRWPLWLLASLAVGAGLALAPLFIDSDSFRIGYFVWVGSIVGMLALTLPSATQTRRADQLAAT